MKALKKTIVVYTYLPTFFLAAFILWWPNSNLNSTNSACQLKKILSAYLLVISWSSWIISTAILSYSFSVHVEMFKKVLYTFFKVSVRIQTQKMFFSYTVNFQHKFQITLVNFESPFWHKST